MRLRRTLYGWCRRPGEFYLGRLPPDAPGPYEVFSSMADAELAAKDRRARLIWCGGAAIDKRLAEQAELREGRLG